MTMSNPSSQEILDTAMGENDANAPTVRAYLAALLHQVWEDGEAFSGKRPFGNSGWEYEVYAALVAAGHVVGTLDEDGYLDRCDTSAADRLMLEAIDSLSGPAPSTERV